MDLEFGCVEFWCGSGRVSFLQFPLILFYGINGNFRLHRRDLFNCPVNFGMKVFHIVVFHVVTISVYCNSQPLYIHNSIQPIYRSGLLNSLMRTLSHGWVLVKDQIMTLLESQFLTFQNLFDFSIVSFDLIYTTVQVTCYLVCTVIVSPAAGRGQTYPCMFNTANHIQ